ncbi:MAG TPA: DUF1365 family protein [Marmoricola sp.]|nr:DUF1365 family protein [Marmoricola sp.]
MDDRTRGLRVAVVGSGVAGLTAAYVAAATARVTVYEAADRLGGHADTHVVREGDGPTARELAIDTGFIVHNERTYPTLMRLFTELGVVTQDSEMSMSVRSDTAHRGRGLEYAGALGISGLFPSWRNALRPAYLRMLTEVPRFHRRARALLARPQAPADQALADQTLADFLDRGGFSAYFRRHFMQPLVAAVWSCDPELALDYPARYLFEFLQHHGMLGVFGSPQWRTVTGGSREYVDRVAGVVTGAGGEIRLDTKVTSVLETPHGVEVTDGNGRTDLFDKVVLAAHPGQSLAMLAEPTPTQREVLGAIPYSRNIAQLHTDASLLPRARRARASWNHTERPDRTGVTVSYDLTRLMRLPTGTHYLVTLGGTDLVDPERVLATMGYEHPVYTPASVAAQRRAAELDSDRLAFAGAWQGWGFHEDGARSGAKAASRLGLGWPERPAGREAREPRVYRTTLTHTRREPLKHRFTYRSHHWVVDLDRLPRHGRVTGFAAGRFEARDHLGDPGRSIRDNVEEFLAGHGIDLAGGQVLMAAQPRAFGYCFNPISVFWCRDAAGRPAATVVEVHNTYGDRHAYLVHPDAAGRARIGKEMYVSPFHGTDGHYDLVVPEPGAGPDDGLSVAVRLTTGEGPGTGAVFDATLRGVPVTGTRAVLAAAVASAVGSLRIRRHGIELWLRGLPVRPRPRHRPQEGVS